MNPFASLAAQEERLHLVRHGALAVFGIAPGDAAVMGARRYLFTIDPGEAYFGPRPGEAPPPAVPPTVPVSFPALRPEDLGVTLPAVGVAPPLAAMKGRLFATLLGKAEYGSSPVATVALLARDEAVRLVETWIKKMATSLVGLTAPERPVRPATDSASVFAKGECVQPAPRAVSWMRIVRGTARWAGLRDVTVSADSGPLALAEPLWLEAVEELELEPAGAPDLVASPADLEGALASLEAGVLAGLRIVDANERRERQRHLDEKLKRSRAVAQEALGDIESILREEEGQHVAEEGSPLFLAVSAVGAALSVSVRPPARSANLERLRNPVEAIARASRFRTRDVILRPGWFHEDAGPLVATQTVAGLEGGRPVALLPHGAGRYDLFDPATGTRTRVDAAVAATLAPIATMLYRPLPAGSPGPWELLRFSLAGHGRDVAALLLVALAGALLGLLVPLATQVLVDHAIPLADRALLYEVTLGLLVAALGAAAFQLSQGILGARLETAADHALQAGLWDRLLRLPLAFFRQTPAGDMQSRVSAVRQIRQLLGGTVTRSVLAGTLSLVNFALLAHYGGSLALVAVAIFAVQVAVTTFASGAIVRRNRELVAVQGSLLGLMVQLVHGISKLRATGAERRAFAHWARSYSKQQKLTLGVRAIHDAVSVVDGVLALAGLGLIFRVAASADLTVGALLAFNAAFVTLLGGAAAVSEALTGALEVVNLAERTRPILEAKPEVEVARSDPGPLKGRVALDRIVFRYRSSGPPVLDGISLRAEPGELVGLVGESGSGKSTILRMLLGFEAPESGAVRFDDQDLSGVDPDSVRRQLGVVLQAGRITTGSIYENIAAGRVITSAEAHEAVCRAGFEDDLEAMPMGLHTVIAEGGTNLSGGQRQRLLIARAIVTKPRILLFDEATSALDNRTQAIVEESLRSLQVTRIVVAHRLTSIRNADRIYVLAGGRIVQEGTFDSLAREEGVFARLLERQSV